MENNYIIRTLLWQSKESISNNRIRSNNDDSCSHFPNLIAITLISIVALVVPITSFTQNSPRYQSACYNSHHFMEKSDFSSSIFNSNDNYFGFSIFDSIADFSHCVFDSLIDFHSVEFRDEVLFRGANFNHGANFELAFFDDADFSDARFNYSRNKTTNWKLAYSGIDFVEAGGAAYKEVKNISAINFSSATFNSASFFTTQFNSKLIFSQATFINPSNFAYASFNSDVDFTSTDFGRKIDFQNATFKKSPDFHRARLPDTLILVSVKMDDNTILNLNTVEKSASKCVIDLRDFPISRLKLRWNNFILFHPFPDKYFDYYEIRDIYSDLLKRFDDLGYSKSYELCDKEFREFRYQRDPNYRVGMGIILNSINKVWWGYGYDLWRIALNTFLIFLIFTFINYHNFEKLNTEAYKIGNLFSSFQRTRKYKYLFTLQYTAFIFFGISIKLDKLDFSNRKLSILVQFQFVVGLICLAFIVNYFFG